MADCLWFGLRVFVLFCHSLQWAGTSYHKVNLTRRINEFHVSNHQYFQRLTKILTD